MTTPITSPKDADPNLQRIIAEINRRLSEKADVSAFQAFKNQTDTRLTAGGL